MSSKGNALTIESKYKISLARQGNRTEVLKRLKDYVQLLTDLNEKTVMPSIVSASLYAGMSKKSLLQWELTTGENSELRQLLDFIRDIEEKYLRENGLLGLTDSKLTTLLLKAEHGLQDQPASLNQTNNFNVSADILAEALEISRSKKSALQDKK